MPDFQGFVANILICLIQSNNTVPALLANKCIFKVDYSSGRFPYNTVHTQF